MSEQEMPPNVDEDSLVFVAPSEEIVAKGFAAEADYDLLQRAAYAAGIDVLDYDRAKDLGVQTEMELRAWLPKAMISVRSVIAKIRVVIADVDAKRFGVTLTAWVAVRFRPNWRIECVVEITPEGTRMRVVH